MVYTMILATDPDTWGDIPLLIAANANNAVSLFGFAPDGACRAASVTSRAVRSYRTVSPLPE